MHDVTLGFIGAGTAGTTLATALARRGYCVAWVASRSETSAERLASRIDGCLAVAPQAVADSADLVFITTPDDSIASVASSLRWRAGQAVVHCSGVASTDILEPALAAGAQIGCFHPLQTFASPDEALRNLPGTTFALEADEPLLGVLAELAGALGGTWVRLRPEDKVLYHASAVMASNYLVTLVKLATDLWQSFGVAPSAATSALVPLLQGTLNNLARVGLPRCLTGPISRGDLGTLRRHLAALTEASPEVAETYRELGRRTIPIARAKGTLSPERAAEIGDLLRPTRATTDAAAGATQAWRTMLKSKIHRARVTAANVAYEGSIAIDERLLAAADILPYERVHVLDVDNGARLETYAIPGAAGEMCINGAAARLISAGHTVIVLAYAQIPEADARSAKPKLVYVDAANEIVRKKNEQGSTG